MARGRLSRGEIWMCTFAARDKRRPVVVISRQQLLEVLQTALVVPITRSIHGAPTEVALGVAEGLKAESCANLARIECVPQARLTRYVGTLQPETLARLCSALAIATGCR
jgi:mRNA interferase MazF